MFITKKHLAKLLNEEYERVLSQVRRTFLELRSDICEVIELGQDDIGKYLFLIVGKLDSLETTKAKDCPHGPERTRHTAKAKKQS